MVRRKLLRSIGAGTIGIASVNPATAESTEPSEAPNVSSEELRGRDRQRTIKDAFSDSDVQERLEYITDRGWQLSRNDVSTEKEMIDPESYYENDLPTC